MNIIITTRCNANCSYCFAKPGTLGLKESEMSVDLFRKVLKFLQNEPTIRILGGEPTTHSRFAEIIRLALKESKEVVVFTNGMIPRNITDFLKNKKVAFLVNLSASEYKKNLDNSLAYFLKNLGEKSSLGINYAKNFDFDWFNTRISLYDRYNIHRNLRLGIAAPIFDFQNEHVDFFKSKKRINTDITRLCKLLFQHRIKMNYDCSSFPVCCLEDSTIALLKKATGADVKTTCGEKNMPLDILPGGEIIRCFGISNIKSKITDFKNPTEAKDYFHMLDKFLEEHVKEKPCAKCRYSFGLCSSGCLANKVKLLRRFQENKSYKLSNNYLYFSTKEYIALISTKDFRKQFLLEGTGKEFFSYIRQGLSPENIAERISKKYSISKARAFREFSDFIKTLKKTLI